MEEDDLPNIARFDFPDPDPDPPDPSPQIDEVQPSEQRSEMIEKGTSNKRIKITSALMKFIFQEKGTPKCQACLKMRRRREQGKRIESERLQKELAKHRSKGQSGSVRMLLTMQR